MRVKNYAIAYLNSDGRGVSIVEPYVLKCTSGENAKTQATRMQYKGYQRITIFTYDELELPKNILWSFVRNHALKE